jgi:hypothetical protein
MGVVARIGNTLSKLLHAAVPKRLSGLIRAAKPMKAVAPRRFIAHVTPSH